LARKCQARRKRGVEADMFVLELNNFVVAAEDLVAFISRGSEEL